MTKPAFTLQTAPFRRWPIRWLTFSCGLVCLVLFAACERSNAAAERAAGTTVGKETPASNANVALTDGSQPTNDMSSQTQPTISAPDALNSREIGASSDELLALAPLDPNAPQITVMSWNLEWFFDEADGDNYSKLAKEMTSPSRQQWDWRRDQIAAALNQAKPSLLAAQEVENKRVLWYLTRSLIRNHDLPYRALCMEGEDVFTEQDVGFLYRDRVAEKAAKTDWSITPLEVGYFGRDHQMRSDDALAEVTKQLLTRFEVKLGEATETVTVLTVHLRAKEEAVAIRTKQARTLHRWLADKVLAGENVIVIGDLNTEVNEVPAPPGSDMAAVCGLENADPRDDLIDLHRFLPDDQRGTHLLPGKAFDRILVSRSLVEDSPERIDLSLARMEQLKALSVRGNVDSPEEHWERYWQLEESQRDLSDHWPIMATFQFR